MLACSSRGINYNTLNSFDENQNLRAVIEIPAGTNNKIEYQPLKNTFEIDTLEGAPRIIKFLPYPVNYGFIPSTKVNNSKTDDALDIMVLGKPLNTGQIISVKPIALLKMNNDGEADHKVLTVPIDTEHQIIPIKDFEDLSQNYPKVRDLIADWFLNYDKKSDIQILGWSDESKAIEYVKAL